MGTGYTRTNTADIQADEIVKSAPINAELNAVVNAFAASTGHSHDGTSAEGGPITKLLGMSITIGDATAGTDITITFDGETNDGVMKWMEDEDYFQFDDDIVISTNEKLYFRDTGIYIHSNADGDLDIISDGTAADSIFLDSAGGITLDADTASAGITYADNGTALLQIFNSSTDVVIKTKVDSKDLIFQQFDGNEVMRIADNRKVYFFDEGGEHISSDGTDFTFASGNDINLTATTDINIPANVGLTFGDDAEKIEGDGTDLTISGNNINLTAVADVVVPANVGITFGTGEKIEGDNTDLTITSGAKINLTSGSTVDITGNVEVSGTYTGGGLMTTGGNIVIPDAGNIGSASDTDAIAISSAGVVTLSATTEASATNTGALVVSGGVGIAKDVWVGDDLNLDSDAALLTFGADQDVSLTHVADTGILLNSTRQLQFGDSGTYIHQSADGVLDLVSDTEIEINATTIDINGAVDISGNALVSGELQTANIGFTDGDNAITIADGGGITAAAGITSTAASNTLGATSFNEANITNVGDIALDSISADDTDINISISDNSATALTIKQGSDSYLIVDTGNSSESVSIGTGVSGTAISIGHTTSETTVNDNLTVTGNLTVNGSTTTVDTTNTTIKDNLLELNSGASSNSNDVGIIIQRGSTGNDALIMWDESEDKWTLGTTTASAGDTGNLNITAGTLVANLEGTASTATVATTVTITDNESTNEDNAIVFTAGGDVDGGNLGLESDGNLTYNPSTGRLTATQLAGTLQTAAQTNITSLGTLSALTVDDVAIDGKVITMTGSSSDTATITVGTNGTLAITTTDDSAAAANITITADGTFEAVGTTITLDSSGGINLETDALSVGNGGDTDVVLTFNANTSDGVITWMEDEDYFQFSDSILMSSTQKIQFGDTASFIHQSADGTLTIDGEAIIDLNASTRVDVSADIKVGGEVQTAKIAFTDGDDAITIADGGGITANTSLTLASGSTVTAINDEDDMSSDSNSALATQQSIKAFVEATAGAANNVTGLNATGAEINTVADFSAVSVDTSTAIANNDAILMFDNGNNIGYRDVDLLVTYMESTIDTLSSLTTTGALNSGSISSGFGNIDNGSSSITTTGTITGGQLTVDDITINGSTISDSGNFTLDIDGNIEINANGGTITFKDDTTSLGTITSSGYSGNAATATKFASTVTINGTAFDGSGNIVLGNDSVTEAMMAANSIDSDSYVDGSIDHAHLSNDCVDGDNIANDSINSEHYVDGSIDTAHIADDQVTYAKIQNVSATNVILGRDSAGAGIIEEISPSSLRTMINVADGATANSAGNAITISSGAINHADTSSQSSVDNSGSTFIQDITLDTYGHVTGINSATVSATGTQGANDVSTGTQNVAGGATALDAIQSGGENNTAFGHNAGTSLTTGDDNVFLGSQAGHNATTTSRNICIGRDAGHNLTTGYGRNIYIGYHAGQDVSTPISTIGIGMFALRGYNSSGTLKQGVAPQDGLTHIAVGHQAGQRAHNGEGNTLVGQYAGSLGNSGDYGSCFGYNSSFSSTSVSNEFTLGSSNINNLRCNDTSISSLSDKRDKTEIIDSPYGLDFINSVRPVQFKWKRRKLDQMQLNPNFKDPFKDRVAVGFIAQELLEAQDNISDTTRDILNLVQTENPKRLEAKQGNLLPVAIKAIQELSAKVDALTKRVEALE